MQQAFVLHSALRNIYSAVRNIYSAVVNVYSAVRNINQTQCIVTLLQVLYKHLCNYSYTFTTIIQIASV